MARLLRRLRATRERRAGLTIVYFFVATGAAKNAQPRRAPFLPYAQQVPFPVVAPLTPQQEAGPSFRFRDAAHCRELSSRRAFAATQTPPIQRPCASRSS